MKLLSVSSSKSDVIKLFEVKRYHLHLNAERNGALFWLFMSLSSILLRTVMTRKKSLKVKTKRNGSLIHEDSFGSSRRL